MRKILKIVFYLIFIIYLFLLLDSVLLNRMSMGIRNLREINLIPFRGIVEFITSGNAGAARMNIIGNILMFIPLGIYLAILLKRISLLKLTLMVALISLIIEVIQFILNAGGSDIDDIILNVTGGLIGILITSILFKIFKKDETVRLVVVISSFFIGLPIIGGLAFIYGLFL